jgi:general secretion pathway protein D
VLNIHLRTLTGCVALAAVLQTASAWAEFPFGTDRAKKQPATDPFTAGRGRPEPLPMTGSAAPLTPADEGTPGATASDIPQDQPIPPRVARRLPAANAAPAGQEAARADCDALILACRRSLAVGDVNRAKAQLQQASRIPAQYQAFEDSPVRVAGLVERFEGYLARRDAEGDTQAVRRAAAELLLEQSDALLRWRDFDEAERLARDADRLGVTFGHFDAKPADLLRRVAAARQGGDPNDPNAAVAAGDRGGATERVRELVAQARDAQAAGDLDEAERLARAAQELRVPDAAFAAGEDRPGLVLLDVIKAQQAAGPRQDEGVQQTSFDSPVVEPPLPRYKAQRGAGNQATPMINQTAAEQGLEERKFSAEIADKEVAARNLLETEPREAVATLKEARAMVEASTVGPEAKARLQRRVDRALTEAEKYITENRARIELDERNKGVLDEIDRERTVKVEVQEKIALMVNEFNTLMDQQRWPEAEVVAKRAVEVAPDEPVVQQLVTQAKMIRSLQKQLAIRDAKDAGVLAALESVDESSTPFDDRKTMVFPDAKVWTDLTANRLAQLQKSRRKRSEKEVEIEQRLKTPVSLQFQDSPLSVVLNSLGKLANVNIHMDPQGLAEEGVTTDTPVTIDLSQDISLKSALNLILKPLHLDYVIKDEVLKITSEQLRDGEVYTVTYNVADLVIPIPNFVPNRNMGLQGALRDAYQNVNYGSPVGLGSMQSPLPVVASRDGGRNSATINPAALANLSGSTSPAGPLDAPGGAGPGGLGGQPQPDFDTLIELITSTISPESWDEVGGPGSIEEFPLNLSLVISQTQDVHEQIADLLEQLRRLQDLQVAIEVRFITLNDNFFERIGVSLEWDINSNIDRPFNIFGNFDPQAPTVYSAPPFPTNQGQPRDVLDRDLNRSQSVKVGLSAPQTFSADLDIPFRQGSFSSAVPQFGGFDPLTAASTGFAILSDVEAYFFIQASQGDTRTNVLQAPKVTLFNGQAAMISDQSFSPFVISVIPVVGDFAAAQQPVIMVLPEGTMLTVQAVVSSDRRFVRLTVVPYFSQIQKVDTFTFQGSRTTIKSSSSEGEEDETVGRASNEEVIEEGTTVQLPTLAVVTVTTTVSVPDGGTVLLGGIKRLSEGRTERGVPMLNKIPYLKRLFSNVAIGRDTESLMLMVTPRIIIQEEEESLLGIQPTP